MDKFALVYEFNKESPLICYQASKELEAKNYLEALKLLESSIEKYPFHPTAYFLFASALAYNSQFDKAKEMIQKGDDLLNNQSTFEYYNNLVDKIKREEDGISFSLDDTVNEVLDESFIEPEEYSSVSEFDLLDDGESKISESQNTETNSDSIVTETLAEIYASQENYDESLQIFEKLKIIKPELVEKYNTRIAEINISIENKKQRKFGK